MRSSGTCPPFHQRRHRHRISSHPLPINTAFGSVRTGILQRMPAPDQLTQDFKEAILNKARIEFLIFRSKVNEQATSITQELAELNALSISINQRILEANEEIKNFNQRMMMDNGTLQDVLSQMQPSPDLHAAMVKGNLSMLHDLAMHASANAASVDKLLQLAEESNVMATRNATAIAQHRKVVDSCVLSSPRGTGSGREPSPPRDIIAKYSARPDVHHRHRLFMHAGHAAVQRGHRGGTVPEFDAGAPGPGQAWQQWQRLE